MKDIDFEKLKKDVRRAVAAHDRYAYIERTSTVLGKIDYIAHQYPDASLTAGQVVELFRVRTAVDEERIIRRR